jgi:hypothetical protein
MFVRTEELPTETGWYWWKPNGKTDKVFKKLPPGIYRLEVLSPFGETEIYLALPKDKNRYPAKWMAGSWAGPIPEPRD